MPNGTDCAAVLQTEAVCVPTQWCVFDYTSDGRAAEWLRSDLSNEIDYLHVQSSADDVASLHDRHVADRPSLLHALYDAYERRVERGSKGRLVVWFVADLADDAGRYWLAEAPLDVSNAMFWRAGLVPAVMRIGIGGGETDRRRFLSAVRDQYFGLPDFSLPYYGKHTPGEIYGNEFDSTLLCPSDEEALALVEHLVTLHLDETAFARAHLQRHSAGGIFVIEQVMRESRQWRRIDWLAVTAYPFFPRLWELPRDDVLAVLDYRRCPQREENPWAALSGHSREKNWDHLDLDATINPVDGYQPDRVTPGDHRTRLMLAEFLLGHRLNDEVLHQCDLGRTEGGYSANDRWLKVEALARDGLGDEPQARVLFKRYRERLQAAADQTARTMDEIAGIALMEGNFSLAYETACRAVERDRFLGHAYDTMVIAARSSGNEGWERGATELAARNGVTIPIHVREKTSGVLKSAKAVAADAPPTPQERKWWQFWR
jgi:hypothetical protein